MNIMKLLKDIFLKKQNIVIGVLIVSIGIFAYIEKYVKILL